MGNDSHAYSSGGGYPNYSQPPPYSAYQTTGYAQEYYGAYDQGQSVDLGWRQQSGSRGTSRGSYRGTYRGRSYGGGYGGGDGSGSSGGGIDHSYGGDQRGGFDKGDGSFIQPNTFFVSQMDPSLTEEDFAAHFGSIGVIRDDRIIGQTAVQEVGAAKEVKVAKEAEAVMVASTTEVAEVEAVDLVMLFAPESLKLLTEVVVPVKPGMVIENAEGNA
ncbi:unnamed protein product [Ceutorhynchus assimilis]|uniref:Uncharacterized protein n=1 Tax=Ceutorhynchus assimilis TaxID=467358 RepID=A0A9N9MH56_9CUCU|nr:unnamed protein product [Ceutorhynchus assimilis]